MPSTPSDTTTALDVREIIKILPHRYPFLLVDRILEMDLEKGYIIGQKNLTINEPLFQGHFPDVPIMPGVLILEALAQAGGVLIYSKAQGKGDKVVVLLSIRNAKFRHPVFPGDVLILRADGKLLGDKGGKVKLSASVSGKVVVEAEVGFALVDKSQI